jgi:hypothetical protein
MISEIINESTDDYIFAVRQMMEKRFECGKNTCLAFVNTEKMYDNINRQKIWKTLHRLHRLMFP